MIEISKAIKELYQSIDNTIEGVYNVGENRTDFCSTKWARVGKIVADSIGREYLIEQIDYDNWIIATAIDPLNVDPLEGLVYLPTPFWISGTRLVTNSEWGKFSNDLSSKLPLVWLLEVLRYRRVGRESVIEFESDLRLFFLDETNVTQYINSEHRENVVEPMERLLNEFLKGVNLNREYRPIDDYEVITFSRFGVENEQGMFKNVLDANLSGVELRVTLSKYKEKCKC
jgi:hypothetical protein